MLCDVLFKQNHWFTYDEHMSVESITKAVSNLALQFGEEDSEPGAMVCKVIFIQLGEILNKYCILILNSLY